MIGRAFSMMGVPKSGVTLRRALRRDSRLGTAEPLRAVNVALCKAQHRAPRKARGRAAACKTLERATGFEPADISLEG